MDGQQTFWQAAWIARFALLNGLLATIELSLLSIAIGTIIGSLGGIALQYGAWPLRALLRIYVDTLRGIPVLVLILASYYGLSLAKIQISAFTAGVVALGGFCGAHVSETVRGALGSIPIGQTEAAKAIGLRPFQRLWYVIVPQALRRMVGPWVNTAVEMVKGSSLLAIIGVVELLLATKQVIARTSIVIPFYLVACLAYLLLNFAIAQAGALLERRFSYIKA
ncbi:MAG: amino acid ABC transporter permease [Methylobacteriaceae bacterium]|nr:amino acid ABC transporter permease [Methylobacteriaceae bacterium]